MQSGQGGPRLADAHGRSLPVRRLKRRSDLTGGARKGDAEGAIDDGNTLIDSSARQLAFLAGLESHIVEQRRLAESVFGDLIGVVNTLPPPEKVQQRVPHRFAELRRPDDEGLRNRG